MARWSNTIVLQQFPSGLLRNVKQYLLRARRRSIAEVGILCNCILINLCRQLIALGDLLTVESCSCLPVFRGVRVVEIGSANIPSLKPLTREFSGHDQVLTFPMQGCELFHFAALWVEGLG